MDRGAWRATGNRYSPEDYRNTAQPTPWPQTFDLQNGKKMNVSCFKLKIEKGKLTMYCNMLTLVTPGLQVEGGLQ